MAKKVKLTRPELKRYRDALARFERFLPMLKLKQQQLQLTMRQVNRKLREVSQSVAKARATFEPYKAILADIGGVSVEDLAQPEKVITSKENIAGVNIPVFEDVTWPQVIYSLFATGAWVDGTLVDLREISRRQAELDIVNEQHALLQKELSKISQRVNLFEKVKIPESKEAIRVIRIKLGDEMTAAVGRSKIAKAKIAEAAAITMTESDEDQPEMLN